MDENNGKLLIEKAQVLDQQEGTNRAFFVKRILERIAALEADIEIARHNISRVPAEMVRSEMRWLDAIAKAEQQLQNLHKELAQYTGDDRMYAARVRMTEGQAKMAEGAVGGVMVMFSSNINRPRAIEGTGDDGRDDRS